MSQQAGATDSTDSNSHYGNEHEAERLDINVALRDVGEFIRSGDIKSICQASERLANVADNYFSSLYNRAVLLVSTANRLRLEQRGLLFEQFNMQCHNLSRDILGLAEDFDHTHFNSLVVKASVINSPSMQEQERLLVSSLKKAEHEPALGLDQALENDLIRFIGNTANPNADRRLISCLDLAKSYRRTNFVLRPVSFELNRGEILGLVGVNASGKSTLLKMLVGDVVLDSGRLTYPYLNETGSKTHWDSVRRRIAYIEQTLPVWPGRVLDNLRYVASIYKHPRALIDEYILQLLQRYGLDRFIYST